MASLHIWNIDEEIVARLEHRAARHGRSAQAEHREILRQALMQGDFPSFEGPAAFERLAAEFRKRIGGRPHTPAEILIREGRDER